MKSPLILTLTFALFLTGTIWAQQGRFNRNTARQMPNIEQRVDRVTTHLYVALELNDSQMKETKTILTRFFESQKELRANRKNGPVREKMADLRKERTDALQKVYTEAQFEKFQKMERRQFAATMHQRIHKMDQRMHRRFGR